MGCFTPLQKENSEWNLSAAQSRRVVSKVDLFRVAKSNFSRKLVKRKYTGTINGKSSDFTLRHKNISLVDGRNGQTGRGTLFHSFGLLRNVLWNIHASTGFIMQKPTALSFLLKWKPENTEKLNRSSLTEHVLFIFYPLKGLDCRAFIKNQKAEIKFNSFAMIFFTSLYQSTANMGLTVG